jgi:regulator of sirC expression with transglutaminase-like and TPR domain
VSTVDDDVTARFGALVAQPDRDVPLDEGALLIAAHALPALDVAHELARLDDLAAGVQGATMAAVRAHLVERIGLAGDTATYHDPQNSLLPTVLDRRLGIPLTLAVVAMEVGRRCDVPLLGVGMPGHFLLRAPGEDDRFLDLFGGGIELDRAGCQAVFARLHRKATWQDSFLDPVGPRTILTRLLGNLATAYRRSGDRQGLTWVLDLRLRLPGATDRDRQELAVVLGAAGRYGEAATVLEATGFEHDQLAAQRLRARLN